MSGTPPLPHNPGPSTGPQMRCADVAPYLAAFADGELSEPLRALVAAHLSGCDSCGRQVARYGAVDALVASLPRTAPSAQVYERVAAAVAGQERLPAVRESLPGRRASLRRRRLEFAEWADAVDRVDRVDGVDATRAGAPHGTGARSGARRPITRRGWRSGVLPTIAAMLLVALTALTIRGAMSITTSSNPPTTPAPSGTALEQTQAQLQRALAGRTMGFTPVSPSYLPAAPVFQSVTAQVTPSDTGSGALLDVTWTFTGPVRQAHLREGPSGSRWEGYLASPTRDGLTWQVGTYQWTPLILSSAPDRPAIGEDRGGSWLALDATVSGGDPVNQQAIALLRLISLSMDSTYQPDPQQIIPAPSATVFHYTGQMTTAGSGTSYGLDGYDAEAASAASITLSREGMPYYTDVVSGGRGIRLDPAHRTYQPYPPAQLTPAALAHGATQVFFAATTLAQNGDLWNVGTTTYDGAAVYDYRWVDQPGVTHVYVGRQSRQVIAVVVDASAKAQPGGPGASWWFAGSSGCASYTRIETLPAGQSPSLSTTPPSGYTQGTVPATLSC